MMTHLLIALVTAFAADPQPRGELQMLRELIDRSTPAGFARGEPGELRDEVKRGKAWDATLRQWVRTRDHLAGLPFLASEERVTGDTARARAEVAAAVRKLADQRWKDGMAYLTLVPRGRQNLLFAEGDLPKGTADVTPKRVRRHYARPLDYAFHPFGMRPRLKLVEVLSTLPDPDVPVLLARRAVFDPSFEVRSAALKALAKADRALIRPVFLNALRHPLSAAADHAALALVALNDRAAVPAVRPLLALPAPDQPFRDPDDRWVRRELARIDHEHNCLLCHRPDADGSPDPSSVLLRPDFSLILDASGRDEWGRSRHYDFVVRVRPLTDDERKEHLIRRADPPPATYPQRGAAQFVLSQLGK